MYTLENLIIDSVPDSLPLQVTTDNIKSKTVITKVEIAVKFELHGRTHYEDVVLEINADECDLTETKLDELLELPQVQSQLRSRIPVLYRSFYATIDK